MHIRCVKWFQQQYEQKKSINGDGKMEWNDLSKYRMNMNYKYRNDDKMQQATIEWNLQD